VFTVTNVPLPLIDDMEPLATLVHVAPSVEYAIWSSPPAAKKRELAKITLFQKPVTETIVQELGFATVA